MDPRPKWKRAIYLYFLLQNCVRHSLSLGQYFRKVERTDGWHGKKGFHWEIIPDKRLSLDTELEKFLIEGGRSICQIYPSLAVGEIIASCTSYWT